MPAPPSASVGQLKPRALASHNVHRVSVRWIYYILDELRIFSRTFYFDPFMSEVVWMLSSSYRGHSDVSSSQIQKPDLWLPKGSLANSTGT